MARTDPGLASGSVKRPPGGRGRFALATLGIGAFVVGTSELVVVGVLDQVARAANVSISLAGTLVTAYASGIAVGGPVVTALTGRVDRRLLLCLSLAAFLAGNLATALGGSFAILLVSRAITGTIHGLFVGVACVAATGLVGPGREGRALSIVFGGITVSTVIGVPLGTLMGQVLGWQAPFVAITIVGALTLTLIVTVMPPVTSRGGGRFIEQARSAFALPVLAMLGVGFLMVGGHFTALTYLTPFLNQVTGVSGQVVSLFLLAYGIAIAIGTFAGGRAADRSATGTLLVASGVSAVALIVLFVSGSGPLSAGAALTLWGLFGFGLVSTALQLRVISLAGEGANLAASLGASAANAGIAVGALLGGQIVANQGVRYTMVIAAIICVISLPATLATQSLRPQTGKPTKTAHRSTPMHTARGDGRTG